MGWLGLAVKIAVGAIVLVVAVVGTLYADDFPVQATVIAKQCGSSSGGIFGSPAGPGTVTVQTKMFGIKYTLRDVPAQQCSAVQVQNFVIYHVRTKRTSLYESEGGQCIYDSVGGIGGCPT